MCGRLKQVYWSHPRACHWLFFLFPTFLIQIQKCPFQQKVTYLSLRMSAYLCCQLLEENLIQSNLLLRCGQCHRKGKIQLKECRKRKTVGQDKGEIQNKVKTPKSTIETRTPAAKWEGERKDGCGQGGRTGTHNHN